MSTVVRKDGFSIRIYAPPREHPPPHVHVYKAGGHAVIKLGVGGGLPSIVEVSGMSPKDVVKAEDHVKQHEQLLALTWKRLHGQSSLG